MLTGMYFFRILYGHLSARAGGKKQVSINDRRLAVVRFLSGARQSEMRMFLEMLLQPVSDFLKGKKIISTFHIKLMCA